MKHSNRATFIHLLSMLLLSSQSWTIGEAFVSAAMRRTPPLFSLKFEFASIDSSKRHFVRFPWVLRSTQKDEQVDAFSEKENTFNELEANEQIQDIQNMNIAATPNLEESIPIIVGGGDSSSGADFLMNKRHPLESPSSSNDNEYSIDTEIELQQFIQHINTIDRGILSESTSTPAPQSPPGHNIFNLLEQLLEKALDTLEDASLMFGRTFTTSSEIFSSLDPNALNEWTNENLKHKPRILVIGSGWASHAFIKCIDTNLYRVLVISPTNYFVFTPMLASSSVGTTEVRSIVESIRESNPTVKFIEGKGLNVNVMGQTVQVALGQGDILPNDSDNHDETDIIMDIPYDVLIYSAGVGPISSSKGIPGLSPRNVHFLKSVKDAQGLRTSVIDLLEKASQPNLSEQERRRLLTFVVAGGGPTGVEYTGELTDFLTDVTGRKLYHRTTGRQTAVAPFAALAEYVTIKLIQGGNELLPMFDEHLRESAKSTLEKAGVQVMTGTKVDQIQNKGMLVVADKNGQKQTISCGLIVWAAGTKPVQLTEKLISNLDDVCSNIGFRPISSLSDKGRIPVDRWQRVLGAPAGSMLAIGDASGTVGEGISPLPQTAQVAAQQGAYIARLLNRRYDLRGDSPSVETDMNVNKNELLFLPSPINHQALFDNNMKFKLRGKIRAKPFQFLNLGQLAYTGGGEALSQVELGNRKLFSRAGSVAYLLWKSVYIVKQVSTKSRILVIFDWCKTKIFGRDVTRN